MLLCQILKLPASLSLDELCNLGGLLIMVVYDSLDFSTQQLALTWLLWPQVPPGAEPPRELVVDRLCLP